MKNSKKKMTTETKYVVPQIITTIFIYIPFIYKSEAPLKNRGKITSNIAIKSPNSSVTPTTRYLLSRLCLACSNAHLLPGTLQGNKNHSFNAPKHIISKYCIYTYNICFCLFCCFTSQVNCYGHCGTVSLPNYTFSWASLNKQLTSTSCTYFRL